MAGPGGGPSRRRYAGSHALRPVPPLAPVLAEKVLTVLPSCSHTKSRKGCENCKRRHIRCDENFPQCRNCTKHKTRCPYLETPAADQTATSPAASDLGWWHDELEVVAEWKRSLVFPFPDMVVTAPDPTQYSEEELCLIYRAAAIYQDLKVMGANGFTLWTCYIPIIITLGATHRFVMDSLLAFMADYFADRTHRPQVGIMAYEHRGKAINGVQKALQVLGPHNAEAVLAATIVLSWQATDLRTSRAHIDGGWVVMRVVSRNPESQLYRLIAEAKTMNDLSLRSSCGDTDALDSVLSQLSQLETHLKQKKDDTQLVEQLKHFLKGARKIRDLQSKEDQFDRLRPLRNWVFWLPVQLFQQNGSLSASNLLVLSHYYAAALAMQRLLPDVAPVYLGGYAAVPVNQIATCIGSRHANIIQDVEFKDPIRSLLKLPFELAGGYKRLASFEEPKPAPSFTPTGAYQVPYTRSPSAASWSPSAASWSPSTLEHLSAPPLKLDCPLFSHEPPLHNFFLRPPSPDYEHPSPHGSSPVLSTPAAYSRSPSSACSPGRFESPSYVNQSPLPTTSDEGYIYDGFSEDLRIPY
ncbi:hypothetical protein F5Y17DRAFT_455250 [Xylariaceae sp. FL0594]|nr:hypothetical protein F5Y17DRAFT_455250 [Xylariaceae sp. FL0594]